MQPYYKRLYPLIKWFLSIISIGYFVLEWSNLDQSLFKGIVSTLQNNIAWILLVLALAIVNWSCEASKLRLLLKSEVKLKPIRAFFIVLAGVAISNFTPARTGEYIGRGLLLKKLHPFKVVIASITGNLAQVLLTYLLGLLAVIYFYFTTDLVQNWFGDNNYLFWGVFVLILVVVFVVFAKPLVATISKLVPFKIKKTLAIVKRYNQSVFGRIVGISFLRYVAFSLQFFILLQVFSGFSLPAESILLVPVAYLSQTLVPVPAVADISVRVVVATLLFGSFISKPDIMQTVTTIWFINLILPGLIGTFSLLISTLRKWWDLF